MGSVLLGSLYWGWVLLGSCSGLGFPLGYACYPCSLLPSVGLGIGELVLWVGLSLFGSLGFLFLWVGFFVLGYCFSGGLLLLGVPHWVLCIGCGAGTDTEGRECLLVLDGSPFPVIGECDWLGCWGLLLGGDGL